MYSLESAWSIAPRVIRAIGASVKSASVIAGNASWLSAAQAVSRSPAITASMV
jgi:hypothetical protein